jgi:hypothetical protein
MPIDFPSSPTTGQVYTYLGKSWVYNGTGWDSPRALSEIGAVQTFANAAARTAAIPTPTEGIVSYLNDVDRLEFWNGSAWASPFGMTLLNSTSFTSQTAVNVLNVFSANYDTYRIVINATQAGTSALQLSGLLLSGSTPVTANYSLNRIAYNLSTAAVQATRGGQNQTSFDIGWVGTTNLSNLYSFDLSQPFFARQTAINGFYSGDAQSAYASAGFFIGYHAQQNSYDGFRISVSSSNITGVIRVYGYRN